MFSSLRFALIDVVNNRATLINSPLLSQYPLHVCDTIETVKAVLSQILLCPIEYISLWDGNNKFIGMEVDESCEYSLTDACTKVVDNTFDRVKNATNECTLNDDDLSQSIIYGSFGSNEQTVGIETTTSNFLQENFIFETTTTISSFASVFLSVDFIKTIKVLVMDKESILGCSEKEKNGWLSKYWGRATHRSKYQHLKKDAEKYFIIKKEINSIIQKVSDISYDLKERISIIDYKARKNQILSSHKNNKYGENIFRDLRLTKDIPFVSIHIPSLDHHKFRMYVGEDTLLGVDDVDRFIQQTQRVNGLSLRMINDTEQKKISFVHLDYRPEYSEITCSNENILIDSTVNNIHYDCIKMYTNVLQHTILQSNNIYSKFSKYLPAITFNNIDCAKLTRLTLKWKIYVPVVRVQDIIDKKLIGALFKKIALNSSQKKNTYISQNFLKYEFDPCIWSKMGNNLSTRIICTIRTTSSNSVVVTVQSTVLKRKVISGKTKSHIDMYLTLWVYDIIRCIVLKKLMDRTKNPQLSSALRLKDIDPYLFGDSVRRGGYTRKCLNWKDARIGGKTRFRQPMVININCKEDMARYKSLKHPSYILKYRNNYYVGMHDELENKTQIDAYNSKITSSKEKIEYFNTIILFEIHEEHYRARNASAGLLYPACVQRKDRLSRRHIDLMRQAYLDGQIEIFGVGKDELIKQLKGHEFGNNNEVGYIMQASRTLPANSFGHLPSEGSGVYEWFRQSSTKFSKGNREFLRKGIIHNDEYNFVHAIFDSLNFNNYQSMTTTHRNNLVRNQCLKWSSVCNFALFRTLQDGTLAQRIDYKSFIKELSDPTSQLLHTEFADLFSYCLSLNIIIFDCDTYSHSSKIDSDLKTHFKSVRNATSAKVYYSTLCHSKYIFLLKMRGIYESIIWYDKDDKENQISCFNSVDDCNDHSIVMNIKELSKIHSSSNNLKQFLEQIHSKFTIVGQVLNANNQCTHIILAISGVPIPIDGLCVPFKNDETKFAPILKYYKRNLLETYQILSFISQSFPQYTPEYMIYDICVASEKKTNVIYAIRLKCGLFCDVINVECGENPPQHIYGVELISNMGLKQPYYPGYINAIILGERNQDYRLNFMKHLDNVRSTFMFLKEFWHKSINNLKDETIKETIYNSYTIPNQIRRKWVNEFVTNLWAHTIGNLKIHTFYINTMNKYEMQLKFVFLNYLFRNPKFFILPLSKSPSECNSSSVCGDEHLTHSQQQDILKFENVDLLRRYMEECTRLQISHLHVTVRKQRRITYIPSDECFVQLDIPITNSQSIPIYYEDGDLVRTIFSTFDQHNTLTDMRKQKYQKIVCLWLNQFDTARPVLGIGENKITFGDLIERNDGAEICLGLSVILNKTIKVVHVENGIPYKMCVYGSTLSYSEKDRIILVHMGDKKFARITKNLIS